MASKNKHSLSAVTTVGSTTAALVQSCNHCAAHNPRTYHAVAVCQATTVVRSNLHLGVIAHQERRWQLQLGELPNLNMRTQDGPTSCRCQLHCGRHAKPRLPHNSERKCSVQFSVCVGLAATVCLSWAPPVRSGQWVAHQVPKDVRSLRSESFRADQRNAVTVG